MKLEKSDSLSVQGPGGNLDVTRYELSGIDTDPETLLLDAQGDLFAVVSPTLIVVRAGYEGEEVRLRKLAAEWSTERFTTIQRQQCQ